MYSLFLLLGYADSVNIYFGMSTIPTASGSCASVADCLNNYNWADGTPLTTDFTSESANKFGLTIPLTITNGPDRYECVTTRGQDAKLQSAVCSEVHATLCELTCQLRK